MKHAIHRVRGVEQVAAYTLRVSFDDGTEQVIDFEPVLAGEIYGPLRDRQNFSQMKVDAEAGTLVWPNGADFDPATLHDWPMHKDAFAALAKRWETVQA